MNFQKLIELREDFNLKQKDIAKLLNITQQTYLLWENGSKIIPLKHLHSLCNYYNVSMDYMLGLSNKNSFNNGKYNIDKKIIGMRLKKFRKEKNITQEELASTLNTTHSTISAYESGKTTILTAFAYEICKRYNISMDYLCARILIWYFLYYIYFYFRDIWLWNFFERHLAFKTSNNIVWEAYNFLFIFFCEDIYKW